MAVATPTYQRAAGRKKLAKKKQALGDGSFPIPNVSYLGKAIKAVGRAAPGKRPALAALIRKRAKQLGSAGMSKLNGSWADPKKSTKQMAQSLYGQLIELNFTPEAARASVAETIPYFVLELAGKKKAKWDPDNDGDNDASPTGDTNKDMAGKLNPIQRAAMKRMIAQGKSPAVAYKIACNIGGGMKKAA